jgi:hypothetical protein
LIDLPCFLNSVGLTQCVFQLTIFDLAVILFGIGVGLLIWSYARILDYLHFGQRQSRVKLAISVRNSEAAIHERKLLLYMYDGASSTLIV